MKQLPYIAAFGTLSGLVWALVPGTLTESWRSLEVTATILIAGLAAGLATSFLLAKPLRKVSWKWVPLLGLGSLPLGAFLYGLFIGSLRFLMNSVTGTPFGREPEWHYPIEMGGFYAFGVFTYYFPYVLIPLAILTTWSLRWVLLKFGKDNATPAAHA